MPLLRVAVPVLLLTATLAIAPAAADELCIPVADHSVTTLATPAATFYVKSGTLVVRPPVAAPEPQQVWRETNGIAGLQPNSEMACGAAPDFLQVENAR